MSYLDTFTEGVGNSPRSGPDYSVKSHTRRCAIGRPDNPAQYIYIRPRSSAPGISSSGISGVPKGRTLLNISGDGGVMWAGEHSQRP